MQTVTIDILNNNAVKLLQDLELLQLIRLHKTDIQDAAKKWNNDYKGAMTKQSIADVDNQLYELRDN